MAIGDVYFATYNIDSKLYGTSNTVQHIAGEFPPADFLILGTGVNPVKGTGGRGRTRMIVFAMRRTL